MEVEELTCPPTAAVGELLTPTGKNKTPLRNGGLAHSHHFGLLKTRIVAGDASFVTLLLAVEVVACYQVSPPRCRHSAEILQTL